LASAGKASQGSRVADFRRLPKIDLHVHLEGSLGAEILGRFARRRGEKGPSPEDLEFADFSGFLKAFGRVCNYLQSPADFSQAVVDLGRRLAADGVVHAEVFFSPTVHTRRGIAYADLRTALEEGAAQVEGRGGPSLLFIADGVRQWGVQSMEDVVENLRRFPSPQVVAVGLGGDESSLPASAFRAVFARARDLGLASVVHAGETGPAENVRHAVTELGACRIGHGIAAADDMALMAWLQEQQITLDVCITSNRRTGARPSSQPHPLSRLLAAGLSVTLGTDDPGLFRTSLSAEYVRAIRGGVGLEAIARLASDAAAVSLLPDSRRQELCRRLERAWE
jgi:aminodeoxyfutalosine deaminase